VPSASTSNGLISSSRISGFTGARNIFNGRFGLLALYQPNGYDASVLLRELGTAYRGEALSNKPYRCGRPLHAAVDAALPVRARLGIERPDDIEIGDGRGRPRRTQRPIWPRADEASPHPGGGSTAQPLLIATALVHGKVGIAEVDGLGVASVLALSDRIAGIARVTDREGRPASRFKGPTGAWLRSRPLIPSGRQISRSPMLSSRPSSATARIMRCSRCRKRV
jgi:hypothetical protein